MNSISTHLYCEIHGAFKEKPASQLTASSSDICITPLSSRLHTSHKNWQTVHLSRARFFPPNEAAQGSIQLTRHYYFFFISLWAGSLDADNGCDLHLWTHHLHSKRYRWMFPIITGCQAFVLEPPNPHCTNIWEVNQPDLVQCGQVKMLSACAWVQPLQIGLFSILSTKACLPDHARTRRCKAAATNVIAAPHPRTSITLPAMESFLNGICTGRLDIKTHELEAEFDVASLRGLLGWKQELPVHSEIGWNICTKKRNNTGKLPATTKKSYQKENNNETVLGKTSYSLIYCVFISAWCVPIGLSTCLARNLNLVGLIWFGSIWLAGESNVIQAGSQFQEWATTRKDTPAIKLHLLHHQTLQIILNAYFGSL